MYAQQVDTGVAKVQALAEMSEEDRAFQARIDADVKIEPTDCDARGVPAHAGAPDPAARAFGDRRHAAGRQLDHAARRRSSARRS